MISIVQESFFTNCRFCSKFPTDLLEKEKPTTTVRNTQSSVNSVSGGDGTKANRPCKCSHPRTRGSKVGCRCRYGAKGWTHKGRRRWTVIPNTQYFLKLVLQKQELVSDAKQYL